MGAKDETQKPMTWLLTQARREIGWSSKDPVLLVRIEGVLGWEKVMCWAVYHGAERHVWKERALNLSAQLSGFAMEPFPEDDSQGLTLEFAVSRSLAFEFPLKPSEAREENRRNVRHE